MRAPALLLAGAEAVARELVEQQIEGARDDRGKVAAGMGVAEQIARERELAFELASAVNWTR